MALFTFAKPEKDQIVQKIQEYFVRELDREIGQFEAGFLLNFFGEEVGPHFYNKGVQDARAVLHKRIDDISEAMDSLEKPLGGRR
jgi:uncharacterized protein (DUF2164 family)